MTALRVDTATRTLILPDGRSIPCSIGRAGALPAADKREGDGATPLGVWPIRTALFRRDRAVPPAGMMLPWRWIGAADGWSDDPADPSYNRPVWHPHRFSAERLVREDGLYDVIVVLGHNDAPVVAGAGSAIFLHCWRDAAPTEGCVAVEKGALLDLLPGLKAGDQVEIG